jgi:hypothetical protein
VYSSRESSSVDIDRVCVDDDVPVPDSVLPYEDDASDTDSARPYEPADTESDLRYVDVDVLTCVSDAPEVSPVSVSPLRNTDVNSVTGPESVSVGAIPVYEDREVDDPAPEYVDLELLGVIVVSSPRKVDVGPEYVELAPSVVSGPVYGDVGPVTVDPDPTNVVEPSAVSVYAPVCVVVNVDAGPVTVALRVLVPVSVPVTPAEVSL